jgi:hypothetical protein
LDEVDDGRALAAAATDDERIGDGAARSPIDETANAAAVDDDTAVAADDDGDELLLLLVEGILLMSINKSSRPRWKES